MLPELLPFVRLDNFRQPLRQANGSGRRVDVLWQLRVEVADRFGGEETVGEVPGEDHRDRLDNTSNLSERVREVQATVDCVRLLRRSRRAGR